MLGRRSTIWYELQNGFVLKTYLITPHHPTPCPGHCFLPRNVNTFVTIDGAIYYSESATSYNFHFDQLRLIVTVTFEERGS